MKRNSLVFLLVLGLILCSFQCSKDDTLQKEVEISVPDGYVNYFIENLSFGNASYEAKVAFHINVDWEMQVVSSDDNLTNWCSVEPSSGNAGLHKVIVRVTANKNSNPRSACIHLMCQGNKVAEIVVEQAAKQKYEAVDLGLSVKWASCNVGATSPEDYGGYYAWGETEEKSSYTWSNYKYWSNDNGDDFVDDSEITDIGFNISGTSYDVAHVKWGGNWRMPTWDEIKELCVKCSWEWISVNGVSGQKVTGPNGNSIFFPATGAYFGESEVGNRGSYGYYWSATLFEYSKGAYTLCFGSDGYDWTPNDYYLRPTAKTVRPVAR